MLDVGDLILALPTRDSFGSVVLATPAWAPRFAAAVRRGGHLGNTVAVKGGEYRPGSIIMLDFDFLRSSRRFLCSSLLLFWALFLSTVSLLW